MYMPGRGKPWKLGEGNPDRIGTAAIADGAITEADLDSSLTAKVNSGGHAIQDEGTPVPARGNLNFVGAGVTASDGIEDTTTVTIAGGGGGLDLPNLVNPNTDFYFYDEFFYPDPFNHFPHFEKQVNSIAALNQAVGGVIQYSTTAVANNVARVNICGAGMTIIGADKRFVMRCRASQDNLTTQALIIGFFPNQSNGPSGTFPFATIPGAQNIYFRSNGTGNYLCETDDNVTPTSVDSGVAVDTSFHVFELDFDPAGPTLLWKIDGATVRTQTTDIPNASLAWYANTQTSTTSGLFANLDTIFIYNAR